MNEKICVGCGFAVEGLLDYCCVCAKSFAETKPLPPTETDRYERLLALAKEMAAIINDAYFVDIESIKALCACGAATASELNNAKKLADILEHAKEFKLL